MPAGRERGGQGGRDSVGARADRRQSAASCTATSEQTVFDNCTAPTNRGRRRRGAGGVRTRQSPVFALRPRPQFRQRTTGACPGVFIAGTTEGRKPRAGVWFLGRGQQPPSHQLGGPGSAVSSPSRVRGGDPIAHRFSTIFSTQDVLFSHRTTRHNTGYYRPTVSKFTRKVDSIPEGRGTRSPKME